MRLIGYELKKIFTFKLLVLLGIVGFILYSMLLEFEFTHFPNGRPATDTYNISVKMVEQFGEDMDKSEYKLFKEQYEEDIETATQYLKSKDAFAEAGITSYEEFQNMDMGSGSEKLVNLNSQVMFKEEVDVFWEIQAREWLMERYENSGYHNDRTYGGPTNEKQNRRLKEVSESVSPFPSLVFMNYNTLITNVTIIILLSTMIILSPLYLRDRKNNLIYLQYTSKTGRHVFVRKLYAGLIASFFMITFILTAFFVLYSQNDVGMFFGLNINSVFHPSVFWFDLTFIQYIILTVLLVYVLGITVAILTAILSRISPNYLALAGVQIPAAILLFWFLLPYLISNVTNISHPIYFAPLVYGLLIVLVIMIIIWRWKREKLIDIAH
ncbi:hypothetical protein ACLIBG_08090 [Virgibacillus sp. W0181]|uniref:hypothetical protein n=1 Tax=Virgibacillus sp. W0181 TaxID=3391581 RepID=UPI003F457391